MAFFPGKDGGFKVGSVTYKFNDWGFDIQVSRIDVTNFTSPSDWREYLTGFKAGTITGKGPYDPSLAPPTIGTSVAFELLVGSTYKFTGNMFITKVRFSTNIEGAAQMEVEGAVTGDVELNLAS